MQKVYDQKFFTKQDLLTKLGAIGASKFKPVRYQFSSDDRRGCGGFTQVRFADGDKRLIAESCFWGKEGHDDVEDRPFNRPEFIEIVAHQDWMSGNYEIISINVDGEDFDTEKPGMVLLAFSIFLSRLDEMSHLAKKKNDTELQKSIETNRSSVGVFVSSEENMIRDCLDTVFDETKRARAEKMAKGMPRVHYGVYEIRFDGFIELDEAALY